MRRLVLRDLGQLQDADVEFGDLTVLVGRQASGKTLFLELLKLAVDIGLQQSQLTRHGLDWNREQDAFFDLYLGEGMHSVVGPASKTAVDGNIQHIGAYVRKRKPSKNRLFVAEVVAERAG